MVIWSFYHPATMWRRKLEVLIEDKCPRQWVHQAYPILWAVTLFRNHQAEQLTWWVPHISSNKYMKCLHWTYEVARSRSVYQCEWQTLAHDNLWLMTGTILRQVAGNNVRKNWSQFLHTFITVACEHCRFNVLDREHVDNSLQYHVEQHFKSSSV